MGYLCTFYIFLLPGKNIVHNNIPVSPKHMNGLCSLLSIANKEVLNNLVMSQQIINITRAAAHNNLFSIYNNSKLPESNVFFEKI